MSEEGLNRFDRIVAIVIHLQSSRVVRARELADRFQVSLRTIYRDIRSIEAAGVPLSGEAGTGYSLAEGYRLPPVMFSREEAMSLMTAAKLMEKLTDKKVGGHFESAMYKIKSVMRSQTKNQMDALQSQIQILPAQPLFNQDIPDALEILIDQIVEKKQVRLQYRSFHNEEETERMIEPIGLFHEHNFWYVMAYCHLRQDYRQFRADRIQSIKRTVLAFEGVHPLMEDLQREEVPPTGTPVVIRVKKDVLRFIKSGRKYYGFVSEVVKGDEIEMTFMTHDRFTGLARWYLMFGDCATIVGPESFKAKVNALLDRSKKNLAEPHQLVNTSSSS